MLTIPNKRTNNNISNNILHIQFHYRIQSVTAGWIIAITIKNEKQTNVVHRTESGSEQYLTVPECSTWHWSLEDQYGAQSDHFPNQIKFPDFPDQRLVYMLFNAIVDSRYFTVIKTFISQWNVAAALTAAKWHASVARKIFLNVK